MYAIRLSNQPIWFLNGVEERFETEQDAERALVEYLNECAEACEDGYMEDDGSDCDFRILEVK